MNEKNEKNVGYDGYDGNEGYEGYEGYESSASYKGHDSHEGNEMDELVERYIYDVTRRLPEKERLEVRRELEASIADMLPDSPCGQDVIDALTKLGAPRALAEQYRQHPRYLVSPAMFELYMSVLKITVAAASAVFACVGAFTALSSDSISGVIEAIISSAVYGALQAAFWVTVGFAIAERHGVKPKPWAVSDLPRLPDQKGVKIPRSSSIAGIALSVIFTALPIMMILRGEWLIVLSRRSEVIVPFSQAALIRSIPYIVLLGIAVLSINILKLCWARWNMPLLAANLTYNVAWASIAIYILHWPDLFSDELISFANTLAADTGSFSHAWQSNAVLFFTVVFAAVALFDIGQSAWNTWKGKRERQQAR
jgi:hypothetical protein